MPPPQPDPPAETGPERARLPPGFAVGEYRIESLLGQGGMGEVYGAVQPEIDARVAIKVLGRELSRDPRLVRRFVDEARAANKIHHPNIIDIFAFGRLDDGRQYFVMERLDGETLAARLARGPLPVAEARRLLVQVCEALQAAHAEKIIHRDLKPENLWIATPRHGQPYIKILDFGIAKLVESRDASLATDAGVAMGTPHYMSPEQCRGDAVDHRADIYSMGVLLYFMWTGRLPFEGATFLAVVSQQMTASPAPPSAHRPVPPALERLILRCLEKDPARRPESARALGAALDAALVDLLPGETLPPGAAAVPTPVPAGPATTLAGEVGPVAPARRPARIAAAVAVALGLLALGGAWLARPAKGPPAAPEAIALPQAPAPAPPPTVAPAPAAAPPAAAAATRVEPALPPSPAPAPAARPARARARDRHAVEPPVQRPASPLDERGFVKENPFR